MSLKQHGFKAFYHISDRKCRKSKFDWYLSKCYLSSPPRLEPLSCNGLATIKEETDHDEDGLLDAALSR